MLMWFKSTEWLAPYLKELEMLILDEADMLLRLGFQKSLTTILSRLPKQVISDCTLRLMITSVFTRTVFLHVCAVFIMITQLIRLMLKNYILSIIGIFISRLNQVIIYTNC